MSDAATRLSINQKVWVKGESGMVRYIGTTEFAAGEWVGIELENSLGKNNGEINGVKYFELEKTSGNYGIFVRPQLVETSQGGEAPLAVGKIRTLGSKLPAGTRPASFSAHNSKDPKSPNIALQRPSTSMAARKDHEVLKSPNSVVDAEKRLHNIVLALQNKVKKMHEEIASLKTRLEVAERDKVTMIASLEKSEHALEQKAMDSEIFEEQQFVLQSRITELEEAHDQLKAQLLHDHDTEQQQDIESLYNALRDLQARSQDTEQKLTAEVSALKNQLIQLKDVQQKLEATERKLEDSELLIDVLRDELDSKNNDDETLEKLIQENLDLAEQVDRLQTTVDQLEQLQSLDEEVALGHAEIENELKEEIKLLQDQTDSDKILIEELKEENVRFETIINNYSEKNQNDGIASKEKLLKEAENRLTILKTENSSAKIDIEFHRSERIELEEFIANLKAVATNESSAGLVEAFESHYKLKASLHKISVLLNSLTQRSAEEDSKAIICHIFTMIVTCAEICCSLDRVSKVLKVDKPQNMNQVAELINKVEQMTSSITTYAKLFDNENLKKDLDNLNNLCMSVDIAELFPNSTFKNREALNFSLSHTLICFVNPEMWFTRVILDGFITFELESDAKSKLTSILKNYYSSLSRLKVVLDSKIDTIEDAEKNSLELQPVSIPKDSQNFHTNLLEMATLFQNEYNSISNAKDDIFLETVNSIADTKLKLAIESVESALKSFQEISIVTIAVSISSADDEINVKKGPVSTGISPSKEYETLREEILRISKLIKDKESNLQEATLKISVLNRKLNENNIENAKFTNQSLKIKELKQENEQLLDQIHAAQNDIAKYIEQIENMKHQNMSFTGNFDNIHEEKEFLQKSALIAEIHSLRNTLSHLPNENRISVEQWLISEKPAVAAPRKFPKFKMAYKNLMKLNDEFTIMPLSSQYSNNSIPRFYLSSMRNEYSKYERTKAGIK